LKLEDWTSLNASQKIWFEAINSGFSLMKARINSFKPNFWSRRSKKNQKLKKRNSRLGASHWCAVGRRWLPKVNKPADEQICMLLAPLFLCCN